MLLFYCAEKSQLAALRRKGLRRATKLWTSLEAAQQKSPDCILIVDPARLAKVPKWGAGKKVKVPAVPVGAFSNLDPYLPPRPVVAAGGYVMRPGAKEPEVLLIFRRSVWDLPKGKQDKGESIKACALREVREEVGVEALRLVCPLSTTQHGYERKGRYDVKTTYWFLMTTTTKHFTPQAEEDIEKVAWVGWSKAKARVGFETLQQHMALVEDKVFAKMKR